MRKPNYPGWQAFWAVPGNSSRYAKDIAEELGVTLSAVRHGALRYGVSLPKAPRGGAKTWSDERREKLRQNVQAVRLKMIEGARQLERERLARQRQNIARFNAYAAKQGWPVPGVQL